MNLPKKPTTMTTDPAKGADALAGPPKPRTIKMSKAFAVLLFATTLALGSAILADRQGLLTGPDTDRTFHATPGGALTLSDDDWDEDDDPLFWSPSADTKTVDACDDDEHADDDCAAEDAGKAAKAAPATSPQNGLFTKGSVPVVKSN